MPVASDQLRCLAEFGGRKDVERGKKRRHNKQWLSD